MVGWATTGPEDAQMPFCTACGKQNPDDAKFCSQCGTRLVAPGPATGEVIGEATATIQIPGGRQGRDLR